MKGGGLESKKKKKKRRLMRGIESKRDMFNLRAKDTFMQKYQFMKKKESFLTMYQKVGLE